MPEMNLSTLNCVYFALFFVGVGYALFVVITGGLSDIDMPDVDLSLIHISEPTRLWSGSRMPSSA